MDKFITSISICSSIFSIIAFIISFITKDNLKNKILYFIIIILTICTTYSCVKYKQITNKQLNIENRKLKVKNEAKEILTSLPTHISYWEPGTNEGILYIGLILLENNKDIYPETYELYKINVTDKIKISNKENNDYKKQELMQNAGEMALQIIKSLSQN